MHIICTFHFSVAEENSQRRIILAEVHSVFWSPSWRILTGKFEFKIFLRGFKAAAREEELIVFRRPTRLHRFDLIRPSARKIE